MARIKPLQVPNAFTEVPPSLQPTDTTPVIDAVEAPPTPPVVLTDAKSPVSSKLNWAGAILTIVGALQLAQEMHLIDTLIPSEDLRAKVSALILFLGGVLTIVLRTFYTYKPTTLTETK